MPQIPNSHLVEEGMFRVHRLNVAERVYVAHNINKGKLHVEEDPPPKPANPRACFHALDILSYFPEKHELAAEKLIGSIAFENKKNARRQIYGRVDLANIGVGTGIGQSNEERIFDFPLYTKDSPLAGDDWASEFRDDEHAPVVQDPTKVLDSRRIECPWCEDSYSGKTALHAMSTHVGRKHKMHKREWQKMRKELHANPMAGVEDGVV